MRRTVLVFVAIAIVGILVVRAVGAPAAEPRANPMFQTTVSNFTAFPVAVQFRHEAMGLVARANCPAHGSDLIGDLYPGGYVISVERTDNGTLFTERHVFVNNMHHVISIHPNGDVTLHP